MEKEDSWKRCLLSFLTTVIVFAQGASGQNTLSLEVGEARYKINRTIYGALLEDWGRDIYGGLYVGTGSKIPNTNGMRNDVIAGLKEIGIGVLQFPGGCKAEVYHWKDGIGDKTNRPGGEMVNGMGTDEYFQLCSLVDCAPFIQANCKEGTPTEMAAWLNYINEKYPNRLKYLGLGNEPWGGCYEGIGVKEYLDRWYDPFNAAIPDVFKGKLIRVGSYYTNISGTEIVLQREIGKMEGLSWHYYTTMSWTEGQKTDSYGFSETDYYNVLAKAYDIEPQLNQMITLMDRLDPNLTCGLQPDEWGAWYNEIAGMGRSYQQNSVRDALIAGQHLNYFNNNCRRIWMAQVAQPVNVIQALFLTKNPPTEELIKTPTFYVYKLYKAHHNATLVPVKLSCGIIPSTNLKTLTASASIDSTRTLHISITNIHASASQSLAVTLSGFTFTNASGEVVTGPSFNSYNDYGKAESVNIQTLPQSNIVTNGNSKLTVTLPAHSVVMLTLSSPTKAKTKFSDGKSRQIEAYQMPGGRLKIRHGFNDQVRVVLSLYTIDGRATAPEFRKLIGPEMGLLEWTIKSKGEGNGARVLILELDGCVKSRRIVLCE